MNNQMLDQHANVLRQLLQAAHKQISAFLLVVLTVLSLACNKQAPQTTSPAPSPVAVTQPTLPPQAQPGVVVGKPYPGTGIVKIINRPEGWIEIDHEEIPGLMPAMEMEWSVQKRSMLDNVKVGDKVNFTVVETGKGEILTELKTVK